MKIIEKILFNEIKNFINIDIDDIKIKVCKFADYDASIILTKHINSLTKLDHIKNILQNSKINILFKKIDINKHFIDIKLSNQGISFLFDVLLSHLEEKFKNIRRANKKNKIFLEFGSINPVGFIHLGNIRNIYIGHVLKQLYECLGYKVYSHYLVNDQGNQVNTLINGVINQENDNSYPDSVVWLFKKYNNIMVDLKKHPNKLKQKITHIFLSEHKNILNELNIKIDKFTLQSKIKTQDLLKVLENNKKCKIIHSTEDKSVSIFWNQQFGNEIIIKKDGSFTYFFQDLCLYYNFYKQHLDDLFIIVLGFDHQLYSEKIKNFWREVFVWDNIVTVLHQHILYKNKKISKRHQSEGIKLSNLNTRWWSVVLMSNINKQMNFNSLSDIKHLFNRWHKQNVVSRGKQIILLNHFFQNLQYILNNRNIYYLYSNYIKLYSILFLHEQNYSFIHNFFKIFQFIRIKK